MRKTSLENGFRTCSKCGKSLPATLEYFYPDNRKEGRLLPICKVCKNLIGKELRKENRERKYLKSHPTPTTKVCKTCGRELENTIENFIRVKGNIDGLDGSCRSCLRIQAMENRHRDPGYRQRRRTKHLARHPEPGKQRCTKCGEIKNVSEFYIAKNENTRAACISCCNAESATNDRLHRIERKARKVISRAKNKAIAFVHYGGIPPICNCCGESTLEFLVFDHINGGGIQDRQLRGAGPTFISNIIKTGFPSTLRILCNNCNHSLGIYGVCPHNNQSSTTVLLKRMPLKGTRRSRPKEEIPAGHLFCTFCESYKPLDDFANDSKRPSGKFAWCKECSNSYRSRLRPPILQEERMTVLRHYGGSHPCCKCCGETETNFLIIHHISSNGKEDRKNLTTSLYKNLIKNHFPPGYEILCQNCHISITLYGYCPHDGRPTDSPINIVKDYIENKLPEIQKVIDEKSKR